MLLYLWMMIQVLAESLPISSSGHVALLHAYSEKLGFVLPEILGNQAWAFDYLLQGISAIVLLLYFFSSWWKLIINGPINMTALLDASVWKKIIEKVFVFCVVADGVTFLCWAAHIDQYLDMPLAIGFMVTALALWSVQFVHDKKHIDIWSVRHGLIVGFVQGCALLPGISRFGLTFVTLRWLGYKNNDAFSISFLIQWPLIVAGTMVGFTTLIDAGSMAQIMNLRLFVFMAFAAIGAYGLLYCVQKIIDKNLLCNFSYYMIVPILLALYIEGIV